tara:strand:+ start:847 stop:1314 length:468 start_codon:yes stop_codon:yes gene_type:complete
MLKQTILILFVFTIGCQEIPSKNDSKENAIIGEWYEIGIKNPNVNRTISFKKPFKREKYLLRHIFTKDSMYTHAVDNQVLNSSLSLIENGNIKPSVGDPCTYVRIERNTYRPCEDPNLYFEIKGDTLIQYWYAETNRGGAGLDTPFMHYFFKKTN